ncbi:MAG: hypothetical protein APF80_06070 [Alphaproteobacteria bacterium BRH_c36]|nr:MAG: hypothetical protein APF80_06070 [Alphaproteobacteria bacterium BRH_c36]
MRASDIGNEFDGFRFVFHKAGPVMKMENASAASGTALEKAEAGAMTARGRQCAGPPCCDKAVPRGSFTNSRTARLA